MTRVVLELSMSLDGYVTGPGVSPEAPMGRGGEALHDWMFEGRSAAEIQDFETDHFSSIGAVIVGRRMADFGIGPWGEEPALHAPVFVVTHRRAETIVKQGGTSSSSPAASTMPSTELAKLPDHRTCRSMEASTSLVSTSRPEPFRNSASTSCPSFWVQGTRLFDDETQLNVHLRPLNAESRPLVTHLTYAVSAAD